MPSESADAFWHDGLDLSQEIADMDPGHGTGGALIGGPVVVLGKDDGGQIEPCLYY